MALKFWWSIVKSSSSETGPSESTGTGLFVLAGRSGWAGPGTGAGLELELEDWLFLFTYKYDKLSALSSYPSIFFTNLDFSALQLFVLRNLGLDLFVLVLGAFGK
jgi:hypothetical protein